MCLRLLALAIVTFATGACSSLTSTRPSSQPVAVVAAPAPVSTAIVIGTEHRSLIRAYYDDDGSRGRGRGRGRGNRGLPPGIARNLERGKPLPPGIAMQMLPRELIVQLPALPSGLQYAVAAGKLLLIDIATHAVHDVLVDALFD